MTKKRFLPNLEILENRDTPSGGALLMPSGTLVVAGTNQSDTISVSESASLPGQVTVDVTTNGVLTTQSFELSQVKNLRIDGGAGNDTISNDTGIRAVIYGGKGDDTISAGSAGDVIHGGAGNDTIYGGAGNDLIFGGKGNDIIHAGSGNDTIFTGPGNDTVYGGAGNDLIFEGKGQDVVHDGTGQDTVVNHNGHVTISSMDQIDAQLNLLRMTHDHDHHDHHHHH